MTSPLLIFFILIALFLLFVGIKAFRKASLDQLSLLEGEAHLFTDEPLRVNVQGQVMAANERVVRCVVFFTTHRFIIAQRPLFGAHRPLIRYMVFYRWPSPESGLPEDPMKVGYISFVVHKDGIKIQEGAPQGRTKFLLTPAETAQNGYFGMPLSVEIQTTQGDSYKKHLPV